MIAARRTLRPLGRALLGRRFRVTGDVPRGGQPLIVACNHPSRVDTLYLLTALPWLGAVVGARPHYFDSWLQRAVLSLGDVQCVPDEAAFHSIGGSWLTRGRSILTYPERTRHPQGIGRFLPWTAQLALDRGVPILPCHLHGTGPTDSGPVRLAVGAPRRAEGSPTRLTAALHADIVRLEAA